MYYECGYETIGENTISRLLENGFGESDVPLKFIGLKSLRMIGTPEQVKKATEYLATELDGCKSSCAEFALHFICEELFDVHIVKTA